MTDKTSLGDRMKKYEAVPRTSLTPRTPMVVRVDGRAFHTYTRGMNKPWDETIRDGMTKAAQALVNEISGAKIAYLQSDEISVLATDYDTHGTQAWFDKVAQKICSVTASIATASFNGYVVTTTGSYSEATFDSRCFVLPREEVANYFIWRQKDATRNSVSVLAQSQFSHKQLQGKKGPDMQEMLFQKGINWNDCEVWQKRGWCVLRQQMIVGDAIREKPAPDWDIPIFTEERDYIERYV